MACVDSTTYTPDRFEKVGDIFFSNYALNYYYGVVISRALRWSQSSNFNAHEVFPNVFVGDVYAAHNTCELKKHNITHVVNVACGVAPAFPQDFTYLQIPLLDCASEKIQDHFHKTSKFIQEALDNKGRVLIHCLKGVSRSATIAAAYVIKAHSTSPSKAVQMLRQNRPIIKPNSGFMTQLEWYALEVAKLALEATANTNNVSDNAITNTISTSPSTELLVAL